MVDRHNLISPNLNAFIFMKTDQSVFLAVICVALGGCSTAFNPQGSSFGCSGMPEGVKCLSVKDVYSATEASDHVNGEVADRWRAQQGKKAEGAVPSDAPRPAPEKLPAADKPTPIRHPAYVMRIWLNAFEDDEGDLYAGQYVFTEIEPRRWSIGNDRSGDVSSLHPLASSSRNSMRETVSPLDAMPNPMANPMPRIMRSFTPSTRREAQP